ncbi:hypothetical protein DH2020_049827 [Rehmannia glutinosa]|uniref:HTH myb-type domain-containing protein n=1 Tax=Rehmannia glutinosa TaxID=99300 RepID=A0ABR0U2N8_REHGL
MQRCQDYIHALEEERSKIRVFQRELPLCLELVTQGTTTEYNLNGQSECSEQTSSPVLEEFIPIKRDSSHSGDEEEEEEESKKPDGKNNNDKNMKKSDWLRSVQLWNQTPDPPPKEDSPRKVAVTEVKRNGGGGAFHPFKKEKISCVGPSGNAVITTTKRPENSSATPASTSSTAGTGGGGGGNKKEEKEGQSRKARRCWSPELHRRFLQALNQLGGSHTATPKQIRELMKVDGLTNDEVKSHLQKYRLHTRRPSHSNQNNNNNNTQAPQFVVVAGGLWMPPEYTTAMATTATSGEAAAASNAIYAPIAALPPPFQETSVSPKQRQHKTSNCRGSHSERGIRSDSPATSSSTHTSTASPAY